MDVATGLAILASIAMPVLVYLGMQWEKRRAERHEDKADGAHEGATNTELRHLIDLIGEVRADVKAVPKLLADVDWLKDTVAEQTRRLTSHMHSDHRELRSEIRSIHDSIHDEEE